MPGWLLAGWLLGSLAGRLAAGWSAGEPATGKRPGWLAGWLLASLAGCLAAARWPCLAGWLAAGWLSGFRFFFKFHFKKIKNTSKMTPTKKLAPDRN